ncbi:fibronectin type III domain-containing protein [Blastococcus sp. SYSU D00813]
MSDPYGQPAWGPQPGWGPQQPSQPQQPQHPQQPAWGPQQPQQPAWGTPPPPAWSPPAGPPPRRSRKGLWWALGVALVAVLVAAGVTVFLLTRPVDPPTGVAAANAEEGVTVSWEGVEGAAEYEVHRGDELLGTTGETSYVDTEAPGGTEHRYAVTALDDDGDRSDRVEADPVVTPLDPLTEFGASSEGADVYLDWEPVTGADRYEITRDGTLLDDAVTESPYLDEDVPLGDHTYELTAVDEDGEGSTSSIDLDFFTRGPWLEAYEIASAFPDLVAAEPGGTGWQDSTCERGTPAGQEAVVTCTYPNGIQLRVLQYADTGQRDAEVGAARGFGGPVTTWSYGDGAAEGDLVLSPPGPATWRYITFYDPDLELFVLRVDWDGHSQEELDTVWFADAPF